MGFQAARVCGFDGRVPGMERYDAWLAAGLNGELRWLEGEGRDRRADPGHRLPGLRSALVVGFDHGWSRPPDPGGLTGMVARYAWGRDYHNAVGKRLKKLASRLRAEGVGCWWGVDTKPILERGWAVAAGLGFPGKNTLQILPARGSNFMLGVLFLDVELEPDAPLGDHCGRCRRCLDGCPTGAFPEERVLDARRCISTWTIEMDGPIPPELRASFGRWVFGCDRCQELCPHNASPTEPELEPVNAWLDLEWVIDASDEEVSARFWGSPLSRPGPAGLRRNACVALGNLGLPEARPVLLRALERGPLVAEHARWALERL